MENQVTAAAPEATEAGQYLTFVLGSQTYALGITGIKEIIEYGTVTPVPMMPAFVRGVINLRGSVVPVLDLQARFGLGQTRIQRRTCVVIVEVENGLETQDAGILVDAVNEVVELPAAAIEPPPSFGSRIDTRFIDGMGKMEGRFMPILNVERIADCADIAARSGGTRLSQDRPALALAA